MQNTIEHNFHLTHRTVRHSKPKMTNTLRRLGGYTRGLEGQTFKAGRTSSIMGSARQWEIQDAVHEGLKALVQKKTLYTDMQATSEDREAVAISGDDIGVE